MAPRLIPGDWRVAAARRFTSSVADVGPNDAYYLYCGRHVPVANNGVLDAFDDVGTTSISAYRDMILGKRIKSADVSACIQRSDYVPGTTYAAWDDSDPLLASKNYYATVNAGSFYHTWVVLDNNGAVPSSITPDFSAISGTSDAYRTGDGYLWQYLYSVDFTTANKFGTPKYFPYQANAAVANAAVAGSIQVVKVDSSGTGYHNYLTGTFGLSDLRVGGNSLIYSLAGNSSIKTTNGFYTGCLLYVSSGTGIGQYKVVTDYYANGVGCFAVLDSEFAILPVNGTQYQVNPRVVIVGDGTQGSNAVARALVNAAGNTIYRVEMLSAGSGYAYAIAAVVANAAVGVVQPAVVRPIYPPPGGHGADAGFELGAKWVSVSVTLSNTESGTIPAVNQFQQVGILRDPQFSLATLSLSNNFGTFLVGEQVAVVYPHRLLQANATATSGNSFVAGVTRANERVLPGDVVYLSSNSGSPVTTVQSANTTGVNLATTCVFTSNALVDVFVANLGSSGSVVAPGANSVTLRGIAGEILSGDLVVALSTGSKGTVVSVQRSGVSKGFDTFVQLSQWTVSNAAGTFTQNEQVFQGANLASSTANGWVHSVAAQGGGVFTVYTSNQVGQFASGTIQGANSGATAFVNSSQPPELVFGSGEVVYLENVSAVTRSPLTTESLNLVFAF